MSWNALDWATDISVGSPTMRLVLILLANKADEKFSCYPSVRTLVAESCAARSTVLEALKRLEAEGLITRVAQYHESGAQRSSRYLLNHPDAPHLQPGPDSGPPLHGALLSGAARPVRTALSPRADDRDPTGPVCGLKWSAVDLDAGEITVHDNRVVVAGHARDKAGGKTKNADQTISIDRATVAALRRWREHQDVEREFFGADYHPGDYVFTFEDGRPPHPDTIRQRFDRLAAAAGLSRITFHDLRHSYATGALKAGVSPKILSARIGHADVGFFLQTYAHVITNDDREAAEQAASFLIGDGWDPEPDDEQG
jgi:integrase